MKIVPFLTLFVSALSFGSPLQVACVSTDSRIPMNLGISVSDSGPSVVTISQNGNRRSYSTFRKVTPGPIALLKTWEFSVETATDGYQAVKLTISPANVIYSAKYYSVDRFHEDRYEVALNCTARNGINPIER